jgi:hypothetical protein
MKMVDEIARRVFDSRVLDQRSYQLGMIYAFAEIVGSGCKRLALSPTLTEEQFEAIWDDVKLIAEEYSLTLEYGRLKELGRRSLAGGVLTEDVELELAWGLGRLLSYSDEAIKSLLDNPRF